MKNLFAILLVITVCCSCGSEYRIDGTATGITDDGKMVFIGGYEGGVWRTLDSCLIADGVFFMEGKLDSVQLLSITMGVGEMMPVVLESGVIKVSHTDAQGFMVSGTDLNDRLYSFITSKRQLDTQLEEAKRMETRMIIDGTSPEEAKAKAEQQQGIVTQKIQELTASFITTNYDNLLSTSVFLMVCTSSFPYPYLTPDLEELYNKAPQSFKANHDVARYVEMAYRNMKSIEEGYQERVEGLSSINTMPFDTLRIDSIPQE